MTPKSETKYNVNEIVDVPLKDIFPDYEWNSRGQSWRKVGVAGAAVVEGKLGDSHRSTIVELAASLAERGQDMPITLRPNPTKSKEKYGIVVGFRRYEATLRNATLNGDKNATIRAVVRELNDAEARALNMRENTAREDLTAADLAWGLHEMKKEYAKMGTPVSNNTISKLIGMNQGWVNDLISVAEKGSTSKVEVAGHEVPIAEAWRDSEKPLPVATMTKILKKPAAEQAQAFEEETQKYADKGAPVDAGAWLEGAKAKAEHEGFKLGLLEVGGFIDFKGTAWLSKVIRDLVKFKGDKTPEYKEGATPAQVAKVVAACVEGIARGKAEPARLKAEAKAQAEHEKEKAEKANAALKKAGKESAGKNVAAHAN